MAVAIISLLIYTVDQGLPGTAVAHRWCIAAAGQTEREREREREGGRIFENTYTWKGKTPKHLLVGILGICWTTYYYKYTNSWRTG